MTQLVSPGGLVAELGETFEAAGHELWLVGGAVRDELLGREHQEIDLATSARPDEVQKILKPRAKGLRLQGVEFGTVGALIDGRSVEVTTYRHEWYDSDSRKPQVEFTADIMSDLSRRDFTVNAIAVRTPSAEVLDPFGGIQDLMGQTIRTPRSAEQAFSDDPLRMLRACRFASALSDGGREFVVADEVVQAIVSMRERLSIVSPERIRDELSKLLTGAKPSAGLLIMATTGLSDFVIPELRALEMEQDPIHRHKDVLRHTFAVVDKMPPDLTCRMGALMHDIGKPPTRAFGPDGVSFHHHEVVGRDIAVRRLRALKYSSEFVNDVAQLVYLHLRFHTYSLGWTDAAVRRYVRDAGDLLEKLNTLVRADSTTRNKAKAQRLQDRMDELEARIAELAEHEELNRLRPEVDGFDIMALYDLTPSRTVGQAIAHMLEFRITDGMVGREAAYEELIAWGAENDLTPMRTVAEAMALADSNRPDDEDHDGE